MERGELPLTTLHLVRHAAHGLLGRVLTGRMDGVALSEAGRAEAARLAEGAAGLGLAAIYSSPVQRAMETAAPIAARAGLPVTVEPGLDEIDFGRWTGCSFDALAGDPEWTEWNASRSTGACPGGETAAAAAARAVEACRRVAARQPGAALLLVSHQDILKSVIADVLGLSLDGLHRFDLAPASRSVVQITGGGAALLGLNLPP